MPVRSKHKCWRIDALLVLIFFGAAMQSPAAPAERTTRLVRVPVWIEDSAADIPPAFEATVNGKTADVLAAQGPVSDQIILIVLDLTGGPDRIIPAKQALVAQIAKLPPNAWVGLLKAQDGLHVLADPSSNRKHVDAAIQAATISITAGLLDTVEPALSVAEAMLESAPVRTAVLYITDGGISDYRDDYTNPVINSSDPHDLSRRFPEALINDKISKLAMSIDQLQPPLFIVHLEDREDRLNQAYQNGLKMLAEATGGEIEVCRSNAEIPDAIARMFHRMTNSWNLILKLPSKVHQNAQVRVSATQGNSETRLSWRDRFVLPPKKERSRK